jgi:hypothetical protein
MRNLFFHGWSALVDQGLPIMETARSHSDTRRTVGLVWTNDQLVAETSLYLTTHKIHNRQTSMSPAGFEPAISACKRAQTHALYCTATGIGSFILILIPRLVLRVIQTNNIEWHKNKALAVQQAGRAVKFFQFPKVFGRTSRPPWHVPVAPPSAGVQGL